MIATHYTITTLFYYGTTRTNCISAAVPAPPTQSTSPFCQERVANRHRAQSRLRSDDNPLVVLDLGLGLPPLTATALSSSASKRPPTSRVVLELFAHTDPEVMNGSVACIVVGFGRV